MTQPCPQAAGKVAERRNTLSSGNSGMAKTVSGSEGPGVPRPSGTLPEDRKPLPLADRLDRLQSGFRDTGRLTAELRQGDAREVPSDVTKTRQRAEALSSFKAAFLQEIGTNWSDFVVHFSEGTEESLASQSLQQALSDYLRAPDQFLRGDSGYLSDLSRGLRQSGGEALLHALAEAMDRVPGRTAPDQDHDTSRLSGGAATYVADLTRVILDTVLGGAKHLPQDFLQSLRDAGAEILRANLTPSEKSEALCQLCKGAVCQHGIGPNLMLWVGHPGEAAATKCFLILITTGETRTLSPDLAKALEPLAQSLPSRLQDFIRTLGMPDGDG
jgi:hypothetical protein